ncbi:hypothetical protein TNCV_3668491 [Trichonephila clavipes]|nr:hypothetical protein TNCV_3668491 [Trichonephila clavipes]
MQSFNKTVGFWMIGTASYSVCAEKITQLSLKRLDSKFVPWSVVTIAGHPKRDIQTDSKALHTVSAVISAVGITSIHLVKRSSTVKQ